MRGGKSRRRQASVNGDVVSHAFGNRTADTSNISRFLNNMWTEVRKQKGLRKQLFVLNNGKRVFHQMMPLCICIKQLTKVKSTDIFRTICVTPIDAVVLEIGLYGQSNEVASFNFVTEKPGYCLHR